MAGVAEGITVGGPEGLDPNDPADFASILEGRGVPREETDTGSPDTSIASGLTVAGPESQPRDPESGRFVPNTPESDTSAVETTDTSGEGGEQADPEVAALLAKFDGDEKAALKSAAHAASLVGKRSEAEDALKLELAEMRGKLDGILAAGVPQQQPTVRLSDDQVADIATTQIETKGYDTAAVEAANFAHTAGDERAYRTILEQWNLEDPIAAMDFNTEFRIWQRDARQAAEQGTPATPAWQVRAEEQAKIDTYGQGFTALKTDLGDEAFALVAGKLSEALDQMPPNVIVMLDSADKEARDAGFRIVADRALRLADASPAPAAPAADVAAATASVQRKLAGAAVASGALRPAEKAPAGSPQNREDAIKEFKRQIVEADTTSVASGLTFGPTP